MASTYLLAKKAIQILSSTPKQPQIRTIPTSQHFPWPHQPCSALFQQDQLSVFSPFQPLPAPIPFCVHLSSPSCTIWLTGDTTQPGNLGYPISCVLEFGIENPQHWPCCLGAITAFNNTLDKKVLQYLIIPWTVFNLSITVFNNTLGTRNVGCQAQNPQINNPDLKLGSMTWSHTTSSSEMCKLVTNELFSVISAIFGFKYYNLRITAVTRNKYNKYLSFYYQGL